MFLEWCVDVVGDDAYIAENHLHYAGISIMQPSKYNKIEPRNTVSSCALSLLFLSLEFFNVAHKLQCNAWSYPLLYH